MLRTVVLGLGALLLISPALLAIAHLPWPAAIQLSLFGALIIIFTLIERRYRGKRNATGPQWQKTGERFVDPTSGKLIEVRWNPTTGERAYIDVESSESSP
jgi:membrane protein implicated in regulation of membrane protease activity